MDIPNIYHQGGTYHANHPYRKRSRSHWSLLPGSGHRRACVDPATGAVPEGIAAQADQSCRNVGAILTAAGSGFDKVVKTTCFLADIADFAAFNEVYAGYFVSKPARSCVAVKDLPKGVLCEVEAIAEV